MFQRRTHSNFWSMNKFKMKPCLHKKLADLEEPIFRHASSKVKVNCNSILFGLNNLYILSLKKILSFQNNLVPNA